MSMVKREERQLNEIKGRRVLVKNLVYALKEGITLAQIIK
jgi:hypothetical protein